MKATYTKLRTGAWGVRVNGNPKKGDRIAVTKKSGETKTETIGNIIWSGDGITLCAIEPSTSESSSRGKNYDPQKFNGYGAPRGGYRKACVTGGNCSSFGSGRSCGAFDCDGY
ncbi:MAG: hypothetical protein ACREU9_00175 [Gammaproteobacteria bacterium]